MGQIKDVVEKQYKQKGRDISKISVGSTVKVNTKIVEGAKERIQAFEGVVIAKRGSGLGAMFTVRKISFGAVGVERTWPINSPMIKSIQVIKKGSAQRAKLYYLRDAFGRKARKEIMRFDKEISKEELKKLNEEIDAEEKESVEAAPAAENAPEAVQPKESEAPAKEKKEELKEGEK
ncbi:MAG TPA: 50S ribosomal protein L19 [bacterium]|nr:50S ribosomal protein L19 [bacterium]